MRKEDDVYFKKMEQNLLNADPIFLKNEPKNFKEFIFDFYSKKLETFYKDGRLQCSEKSFRSLSDGYVCCKQYFDIDYKTFYNFIFDLEKQHKLKYETKYYSFSFFNFCPEVMRHVFYADINPKILKEIKIKVKKL